MSDVCLRCGHSRLTSSLQGICVHPDCSCADDHEYSEAVAQFVYGNKDDNNKDDNNIILALIHERLEKGKKSYGHGIRVDDDTRQWGAADWEEMALEEALDAALYLAASIYRLRKARNAPVHGRSLTRLPSKHTCEEFGRGKISLPCKVCTHGKTIRPEVQWTDQEEF